MWNFSVSLELFKQVFKYLQKSITFTISDLKGLRIAKMKIYIFLASAQTKRMQPILVSYEAPLRSNLQKTLAQWGSWPSLSLGGS